MEAAISIILLIAFGGLYLRIIQWANKVHRDMEGK